MYNNIKLADRESCTGCMACMSACHKGCISFDRNALHYYPVIDYEACVKCGQRIKTCPILNNNAESSKPDAIYAAWHKDNQKRFISTSGGVAYALEEAAINHGFYVCGAAFNGEWRLSHILTSNKSDIVKFRGSKYLQSDISKVFKEIRDLVSNGEKVLFVGTPCQIDALYHFIHSNLHNQLYTVEIICHGVNSYKVWEDYKDSLEQRYRSKLVFYNFRDKSKGWGKLRVEYKFDNGRTINCGAGRNLFHIWFGKHLILRKSCLNCKYRNEDRIGDLVVGDFWGIEKVANQLFSKRGLSVLMKRTKKGQLLINNCDQLELHQVPYNSIYQLKGYLTRGGATISEFADNSKFEDLYIKEGFGYMAAHYPIPSYFYVYGHKLLTLARICKRQLLKLLS